MGKIILSAFADEHSTGFDDQLTALRGFGIDHIEIRAVDGKNVSTLTVSEVKEVRRKADAMGIKVSAVGSPVGKIKLDGDLDGHLEMAKRVFESANLLGTKYVRMFSFYAPEGKLITECRSRVFSELERLALAAKEQGVVLCHENEAEIYGNIPERCREITDHFGGAVKTVFDMGNYVLEGVNPYEAYKLLGDTVAYFHIKDALYAGAIVPPGKGEADIQRITRVFCIQPHFLLHKLVNFLEHITRVNNRLEVDFPFGKIMKRICDLCCR